MLVTFKSRAASPDITMFGDVAMKLIRMMGRRDSLPGQVEAEGIQSALQELRNRTSAQASSNGKPPGDLRDDQDEESVSLHNRAIPLIELLEAASEEGVPVTWDKGG